MALYPRATLTAITPHRPLPCGLAALPARPLLPGHAAAHPVGDAGDGAASLRPDTLSETGNTAPASNSSLATGNNGNSSLATGNSGSSSSATGNNGNSSLATRNTAPASNDFAATTTPAAWRVGQCCWRLAASNATWPRALVFAPVLAAAPEAEVFRAFWSCGAGWGVYEQRRQPAGGWQPALHVLGGDVTGFTVTACGRCWTVTQAGLEG